MPQSLSRSQGFTLVELLVALVLGIMLSAGIANIYLQNARNYKQDEELARLQENARYALNLLKRELIMAGYVANIPHPSEVPQGSVANDCVASGNWALNLQGDVFEVINNYNAGSALETANGTTWNCLDSTTLVDGADLFSIKRTADRPTLENGVLTSGASAKAEQWYLRSYNDDSSLGWTYVGAGESFDASDATAGSTVDYWQYYSRIFFLRNHSRTNGDNIPSLCMASLKANAMASECLVEGIEDMQIEIGIDTNDDSVPDIFKNEPSAAEIAEAVVVRVYLLVRSVNSLPGYTNEKTYQLGGKAVDAKNDGYIRRVFSTSVQMRNAKLPNA